MADKSKTPTQSNVLGTTGLSSKSISGLKCYRLGTVSIIEISYSGGSQLIKVNSHGQIEIGGTDDWGTGTAVQF